MTSNPDSNPCSRAELRRRQILDASAHCFRRYGFHAASIAKISREAGMSPGHIYHFFENKEAIIAAIVEERVAESIATIDALAVIGEFQERLLAGISEAIMRRTEPSFSALWLEVTSEAARNPAVAAIVQKADIRMRQRVTDLVLEVRRELGCQSDYPAEYTAQAIMSLFEGVVSRVVQYPECDRAQLIALVRVALLALFSA